MKTLTFIAALLVATAAHGYEFRDNPDRFPSIGFNASAMTASGDRAQLDNPNNPAIQNNQVGNATRREHVVGADLRLPFSESGTLTLGMQQVNTRDRFTQQSAAYRDDQKLEGYRYSVEVRVYINR